MKQLVNLLKRPGLLAWLGVVLISLGLIPPRPSLGYLDDHINQAAKTGQVWESKLPPIQVPDYPKRYQMTLPPDLEAKAYLVKDLDSKVIIAQKNSKKALPIASLTKLMTALTALESYPPKSVIPITIDSDSVEGQTVGFKAGEDYLLEALIAALIINSANDAALNLAAYHPNGIEGFVDLMNQNAAGLGMVQTRFANPVGYDDPNNYSTVSDLSLLAEAVLERPLLSAFAQAPMMRIVSVNTGRVVTLRTTNDLLGKSAGILGLKTGWTPQAGECLISLVESASRHWYLTIVLGSQDRFGETLELKNWVDSNIRWVKVNQPRGL